MTIPINPTKKRQYDQLKVEIYASREQLGEAAAAYATEALSQALTGRNQANLILATGNSQLSFLSALLADKHLDWSRITVFHMDEYVGIDAKHPASFRRFLQEKIVQHVKPAAFHGVIGDAPDTQAEIARYEALLRAHPADLCCMGIGENGHLAFNDPPFADFDDPVWVKEVTLDEVSRKQQVGEGHFSTLEDVPQQAITLTIPALLAARDVLVIAPERRKAEAVKRALEEPVSPSCPASILRQSPHARLLLDEEAASLLSA